MKRAQIEALYSHVHSALRAADATRFPDRALAKKLRLFTKNMPDGFDAIDPWDRSKILIQQDVHLTRLCVERAFRHEIDIGCVMNWTQEEISDIGTLAPEDRPRARRNHKNKIEHYVVRFQQIRPEILARNWDTSRNGRLPPYVLAIHFNIADGERGGTWYFGSRDCVLWSRTVQVSPPRTGKGRNKRIYKPRDAPYWKHELLHEAPLGDSPEDKRTFGHLFSACLSMLLVPESEWTVEVSSSLSSVTFTCGPEGAREMFRLRDKEVSSSRRSALRNWVKGHTRKLAGGGTTNVRPHLRGSTDFTWRGLSVRIYPSDWDLESNEIGDRRADRSHVDWLRFKTSDRVDAAIHRMRVAKFRSAKARMIERYGNPNDLKRIQRRIRRLSA